MESPDFALPENLTKFARQSEIVTQPSWLLRKSPDFALAESLPNFGAKRMRISLSLESRLQAVSPSGPRERGTPNVEKSSFFSTPPG